MSTLSAQRDELRWLADHLEEHESHMDEYVRAMRHAADTIWQLRNDCVDLRKKNEKLRNLIQRRVKDYMYESCGDCWGGLCDECQCWVSECADELRELGIEVE